MTSGEPIDFGERGVDALRVEGSSAREECILVAERAVLRAAAADDDRIGHEIAAPPDQVAPDWRQRLEGPAGRGLIALPRSAGTEILEKRRKDLLPRAEEDRVRMRRCFFGQRRHVKAPEGDEAASRAVGVRDRVGAKGIGDVDLDDDQVRGVLDRQALDVLVNDRGLVVVVQIGGQCCEAERREQRVLDRPPVRARRFGQGGQDEFSLHCKVNILCHAKISTVKFRSNPTT
jgi:hypothetical protein